MNQTLDALQSAERARADSTLRFDDGGEYRIEIPSVEGPDAFEAVVDAAGMLGVPLHRVSQGSGISLLTDAELNKYVTIGADHNIEVCLFVGPRAPWNGEAASALVPDGKYFGWRHLTVDTLRAAFDDVERAVDAGIRSVLVSDEGLIRLIAAAKASGDLPADLVVKLSAVLGIANPLGAAVLVDAGGTTVNIAGDASLGAVAAFRHQLDAPLDLYIEGPDNLGGFLRYHDLGEIVRIGAPVHLKFGLRNAPGIYPSGGHLAPAALATARERVRRAAIGLEHLGRQRPESLASPVGAMRPGVPVIRP